MSSDFGLTEDITLPFASGLHVTYWASDKVEFRIEASAGPFATQELTPTFRFVIQGQPQIEKLRELLERDPKAEWRDRKKDSA